MMPTMAPTLADAVPSNLVLGMGSGTFAILVLTIAVTIVWLLSMSCELKLKVAWRFISGALYVAVFLLLLFSPRESKYPSLDQSTTEVGILLFLLCLFVFNKFYSQVYDESVIPRIAVSAITVVFGFIASGILLLHFGEKKQV